MYSYVVEVLIENIDTPFDIPTDIFTLNDRKYIKGKNRQKPGDFELHLAVYLLSRENIPELLLEPINQWINDNKLAGSHYR